MSESNSAISVNNLWQVFGPNPEKIVDSPDAALPRAELREKTGNTAAVRDVSFDVAPGEVFVVMGLSGSGKSTLVRCLTRLIEPTSGSVVLDGEDIMKANDARLRELRRTKFSMVFQNFGLLPHRRVIDNIAFALEVNGVNKEQRHARANEVIELVGLQGFAQAYPEQLSGGMQQRVGLARALAADPKLLLLDEPMAGMSTTEKDSMSALIQKVRLDLGISFLIVEHDIPVVMDLSDKIVVLDFGRKIAEGPPQQVQNDSAVIAAYLGAEH